jgi:hypothetical protein
VIFDVTTVIVLEHHESRPYKTAKLIDKYCVFSERNSQSIGQTSLLSHFKKQPQSPQPSAVTTLVSSIISKNITTR